MAVYHVVWECVVEQWLGVHCVWECVAEQWLGVHCVWECVVEQWLGVCCVWECVVEQWLGVRRMLSNKRLLFICSCMYSCLSLLSVRRMMESMFVSCVCCVFV